MQILIFVKEWLYGDESVVILIFIVFLVGIVLGLMLCEKFFGCKVEIGLVLFGLIGLIVFGIFFWWYVGGIFLGEVFYDWLVVLCYYEIWVVLVDILFIGIFGGFYIVLLYVLIQVCIDEDKWVWVIVVNNIFNVLFMVVVVLVLIFFFSVVKLLILQLFFVLLLMNVVVNVYIFKIVLEFIMCFLVWLFSYIMYWVWYVNLEVILDEGVVVLVCNYVLYVDVLLIVGLIWWLVCFVMYYRIFLLLVFNFVFCIVGVVFIVVCYEDEGIYECVFQCIVDYLRDGELVCIFFEGKLIVDGEMNEFCVGIEWIIEEILVLVIFMVLQGLWGSFFSCDLNKGFFCCLWLWVSLVVGELVVLGVVECFDLQVWVMSLCGEVC